MEWFLDDVYKAWGREILIDVGSGKSNAEISAERQLSANTVKTHIKHLLAKLEVRDRVQAVIFAYENQLVSAATAARTGREGGPASPGSGTR